MKFKADEIASVIQKEIEDFRGEIQTAEVGRVIEVGDGIARCTGLSTAMSGEMVEFSNGTRGFAFNLEENSVGVVILGDYLKITEGDETATPCIRFYVVDKIHKNNLTSRQLLPSSIDGVPSDVIATGG